MIKLVVRRFLGMIPLLFAVALCTFFLVRLAPGDYFSELSLNPQISPETLNSLRQQYGLDRPWYAQFAAWFWRVLHGDLGYSISYHGPVASLLGERLFNTVLLAVSALSLALLVSFPLGLFAVAARSRWVDRVLALLTSLFLSLPTFLWALLALLFAAKSGLFPIGSATSIDHDSLSWSGRVGDVIHHLVLPASVLAVRQVPGYLRQLSGSLREILGEEYIVAARAKGLAERAILLKHALRNALNPIVTMFGQSLGSLLSGAFVVEAIMSWPGIGNLAVSALLARDLDVVVACVLYAALLLAAGNLLADILLGIVDPRIRIRKAVRA
ncbi:MAG: ABC transporter permease [Acidobacteriota bacterium]